MEQKAVEKTNAISKTFMEMRDTLLAIFRQANIPEEECKDLVQNVFLRLLSIDVLRTETIKNITATIALRMRTDYLRHKAMIRKLYANIDTANIYDYSYNDTSLDTKELALCEARIIDSMGETNRQIYELNRFEDYNYDEIAKTMNMSYRAVESRLYRARHEVRAAIRKIYGT